MNEVHGDFRPEHLDFSERGHVGALSVGQHQVFGKVRHVSRRIVVIAPNPPRLAGFVRQIGRVIRIDQRTGRAAGWIIKVVNEIPAQRPLRPFLRFNHLAGEFVCEIVNVASTGERLTIGTFVDFGFIEPFQSGGK